MILEQPILSKSQRVLIAQRAEQDDERVCALRLDPWVRRFLPFHPSTLTPAQVAASRLASLQDPTSIQLSIWRVSGPDDPCPRWAGELNLRAIDTYMGRSCEWGISLSHEFSGQDLATDAVCTLFEHVFETMKMHRLGVRTSADHVQLKAWLERMGFVPEGIQRHSAADGKGGYYDLLMYSLMEDEWRKQTRPWMERKLSDSTRRNVSARL